MLNDLIKRFADSKDVFLIENNSEITYEKFYRDIESMVSKVDADYAVALEATNTYLFYVKFLALLMLKIPVALVPSYQFNDDAYRVFLINECAMDFYFSSMSDEFKNYAYKEEIKRNPFVESQKNQPLFIIKTSGSSGKKFKFILHSIDRFISKYKEINKDFIKTLSFSPAESIAGVETLFEVLALQKTLVACGDRPSVKDALFLMSKHQVDLLQTTPSFLNLMIFSGLIRSHDLQSLKAIYFGSEQVSEKTIFHLKKEFPGVELVHTYGMSEIGILLTETCPSREWLTRPKQSNVNRYKVEKSSLFINSKTQMLGYLNYSDIAPANQEWFETGDHVQDISGYLKIVGRSSDLINVAGHKFYPYEVEEKLLEVTGVKDVVVIRETHELLGNVIIGRFVLEEGVDEMSFRVALKKYSELNLPTHMRLHKVELVTGLEINFRSKKVRVK